jgi:hypothetical protein
MVVFNDQEETKRIDFLRRREEEELAQMLAGKYGVEYVDLRLLPLTPMHCAFSLRLRRATPRSRCLAAWASASTLLLARQKTQK